MLEGCSNILECEEVLVSNLENINLIGDIVLSPEDTCKLSDFISKRSLIDINDCTKFLKVSAPTSLACYLVWNGILYYHEGDFWTQIEKNTGLSDPNWQSKWGNIFLHVLKNHKLPIFETQDAHKYVTNILIQGTIPNSCLCEYYDKILYPLVTKELISSDPSEINFLLKNLRDYEFKRLEKESQIRKLEDIKNDYILKIGRINSIIDLWDEFEGLQLLRSNIESVNEPNIDEIVNLRNKTELEIIKTNKCIEDFEADKDKYFHDLSTFSEEDSFILRHSETIEDRLKISLELIAGKKDAAELHEKIESIKKNIDETIDPRNKIKFEIIKTNKCIEDLESNREKHVQDLSKFSEEDSFILRHSETIEDGLKISLELIAGKKEATELHEKIESIKKNIDETIDPRNKIKFEIIKTNKCIEDLESNRKKHVQDLSKFSEEDSFILRHSVAIEDGLKIAVELIVGKSEATELQEKIESIKKNIDETINSRNKTELEIIKTNKCIEELESNRKKHVQDLSKFSEEDSFILRHSVAIEDGPKIAMEVIVGKSEATELHEKIESIKKNIDEITKELFVGTWNEQYINIIRYIRYEKLEEKIEEYQSLKDKEDEDKKASKSLIKSLFIKLSAIIPFLKKKEEKSLTVIYDEIQALFNGLSLDNKLQYEPTLSSVPMLKEIPNLYDDYFAFKEEINRIEGANQVFEAKLSTIVNSVGIDSNEDVQEIQIILNNLSDKLKTSQENEKLAQIASVEIEKINAKIENEQILQAQLKTKLNDLILKEIPELHSDCSFAKEKINKVEGKNQELEAKLSTIVNLVGIDSDDVIEIHIKLTSLKGKIKISQEREELAQIASVEIEKINAKIENEQSYLTQLKTKLDVLLLKEIPKLHYDYSLAKEKINRIEDANQELEAKLSVIANSVGIDSDENIREIQIKFNSLSDKLRTSPKNEKLTQIASIEIEKINTKIENEQGYLTQLKTKLDVLLLKEIPKLHYDYSFAKEKINRIEGTNQELEAELSTIVNLVGIDTDENIREIHIKLTSLNGKIKTSQEKEELAQIASVEIENIIEKIENELIYQTELKTKLNDLDRNIAQLKENSELKRLKQEFDLKTNNLLDSYPNLDELKLKIERFKREGQDKSLCLENIKIVNENKMKIEAQINNLESLPLQIPTLKFFTYVDKPIQRYFLLGGKHAEDFLFQSSKMLRQSIEKGSLYNLTDINLPERIINSFEEWWENNYQKSSKYLDDNRRCGFHSYKSPIVYFDYSGEIRCKFPSQFLQLTDSLQELCLSLLADNNEVYNLPLSLYRLNESLLESEDLDFEIKFPAENYEFQLIHDRKVIKSWDIPTGLKPTIPFIAFDYESKKMIQNNEIPRTRVLIVLKSEYLVNPADCLFEEGDLYGEWSRYNYKCIDLTEVDTFTISSVSNEYSIQVMERSPWDIELSKEHLLQGVYSGDSELYAGEPPSIKVSFTEEVEIDNWILSIYKKNEFDFSYLQQNCLSELKDVLRIDHNNNLFEIPLEAEVFLGKEVSGEFIVRLKNNLYNYDKQFIFCFFPYINIQFNELIYLPKDSGYKAIDLTIQLLESSNFEVNPPAKIVSQRDSSLDITTDISERDVTGTLKYTTSSGKFSLPIRIQIPRVTWGLKGLRDDKYNKEINEILEIPDEIFYDIDGESLLLKVSFPSSINGICTLKHQDSGQAVNSKIKGKVAVFNILRFIDTVKATLNSVQTFGISVSDIGNENTLIDNNPLFLIRKWTIQNIVCEQKKEENKRIFHIKWDQKGSVEKACIVFWRLENEKFLKPVPINGSKNSLYFEIDEKLVPGRYLLHFTREDPWSQPAFPGENAPNSKEIYIDMDVAETSLLESGNKEFEVGNYVEAIDIYRKVPKSSNIDNVWIRKITHGLIYNHKYSEAIEVFYHLVTNDKRLDDIDCFYLPSILDTHILSRQKDLKNEDLIVMLNLLKLIANKKYKLSSERSKSVISKVNQKIKENNLTD